MHPDVIILDELADEKTVDQVCDAVFSGVVVITSAHGNNVESVKSRRFFKRAFDNNVFDYSITLSARNGVGTVEEVSKLG